MSKPNGSSLSCWQTTFLVRGHREPDDLWLKRLDDAGAQGWMPFGLSDTDGTHTVYFRRVAPGGTAVFHRLGGEVAMAVPCPRCGAEIDQKCRSKTGRTSMYHTHRARLDVAFGRADGLQRRLDV